MNEVKNFLKIQGELDSLTLRRNADDELREEETEVYFFSPVEVDGQMIQGFTFTKRGMYRSLEKALNDTKDLDYIHVNKVNSRDGSELFCIASKETMNKWYNIQYEGAISRDLCEKFDYFRIPSPREEIEAYRREVSVKHTLYTV